MKLYKSILGLMTAALVSAGFTSCDSDFDYPPVIIPETVGDGSPAAPYDVNTVLLKIYQGDYQVWRDYYVKGVVSKIDKSQDFNPAYGNITYYISNDGAEEQEFEIYRGLGINGEKFTGFGDLSVGDEVIVCCKLTYYNNSVAETTQGAALVSLNGSHYDNTISFPEPTGNGSAATPFNVVGMLEYTFSDDLNESKLVYVEGIVSRIDASSFNPSFGNINYYISDTGTTANEYYVYRGLGLNGTKFASAESLKVGDKVIVKGYSTLYNGSVAETKQNAPIVSLNGSEYDNSDTGSDEPATGGDKAQPTGEGTAASPYNVSKALDVIKAGAPETEVYVTGTICSLGEFSDSYGNYTYNISDDGKTGAYTLEVYRGKYFNGEKFTAANQIKIGDVVVVKGVIKDYNGKAEFNSGSSIITINGATSGSTPETPDEPVNPGDKGSVENPYSVAEIIAGQASGTGWAKGYIVGWVNGQVLADGATFTVPAEVATNLLIAATAGETNVANCVPVQLPAGAVRAALNLMDNPGNLGKEIALYGSFEKYFGTAGIKTVTDYLLDGQAPSQPEQPTDAVYSGLITGADDWTLNVGAIPEGLTYVWAWDAAYGLKASAYANGSRFDTDIYAVSPAIKLTSANVLTFDQAINYQTNPGDLYDLCIREKGTDAWTALTVPTWPAGNNWTFTASGDIDLSAYAGMTVEFGFHYVSTSTVSGTWEIKNFVIK